MINLCGLLMPEQSLFILLSWLLSWS